MAKKKKKEVLDEKPKKMYSIFGDIIESELPEEDEGTKRVLGVFDLIDMIFKGIDINKKFTREELGRMAFILNRFMSIQFPLQANMFSQSGINDVEVVRFWANFLKTKYQQKPSFLFTRTKKVKNEYIPPEEIRLQYCKMHQIDNKTFKDTLMRFPDELKEELDELEHLIVNFS